MMTSAPSQSGAFLPTFIQPLRELMVDAREEVKEAALAAMQFALSLVGNRDLEPLLQVLASLSLSLDTLSRYTQSNNWGRCAGHHRLHPQAGADRRHDQ